MLSLNESSGECPRAPTPPRMNAGLSFPVIPFPGATPSPKYTENERRRVLSGFPVDVVSRLGGISAPLRKDFRLFPFGTLQILG